MEIKKYLILTLFCLVCTGAYGQSDYYWVGGSGDWSNISHWATTSGGTQNYGVIPSPKDNVIFDENSFSSDNESLNINVNRATFNDMDWSKIDKTIRMTGSGELESFGSIILSEKLILEFNGAISFRSSEIDETFKTANLEINASLSFRNSGTWTLVDSLKLSSGRGVQLNGATVIAAENYIIVDFIDYSLDETRQLNITNTTIELRSGFNALNIDSENLTLMAGGSQIFFTNDSPGSDLLNVSGSKPLTFGSINFMGANGTSRINNQTNALLTFEDVLFKGNGQLYGNNEMNDLTMEPGKHYELESSKTQKINGELTADGDCSQFTIIRSSDSGSQATIEKSAGQVDLQFIDLNGVAATGGATFTASNSIDSGNNQGWVISTSVGTDFYWIGDGGSWEDPQHWSLTSGGAPAGCLPTLNDNVFFDENSFTLAMQEVLFNSDVSCKSMDWTGALHNPTFEGIDNNDDLNIYGSLTLIPGMNFEQRGSIVFMSDQPNNSITTGNLDLVSYFNFANPNGGWTLTDSLKTTQTISLAEGNLTTGGNYVEAFFISSTGSGARSLDLTSSLLKVEKTFIVDLTNLTLDASDATVLFFGSDADFSISGETTLATVTFGQIIFEDSENGVGSLRNDITEPDKLLLRKAVLSRSADLNGDLQFDSLFLASGKTYQLNPSSTTTINKYFEARGDCDGVVLLKTTTAGSEATFSSVGAAIVVERSVLMDIHTVGGATFIANNSLDQGNNDGWTFTNVLVGTDLYWVGGTGNWHDIANWSYTSGGTGGACIPTSADNVFFDGQSFTAANQVVTINKTSRCRNMDWSGALFEPQLSGGEALYVSGSLHLIQEMTYQLSNRLIFDSNELGQTINTGGTTITSGVQFFGVGGGWEFLADFIGQSDINIDHIAGQLKTNGHVVAGGFFNSFSDHQRGLDLGQSEVHLSTASISFTDNFTFDLAKSKFLLEAGSPGIQIFLNTDIDIQFGDISLVGTNPRQFANINVNPFVNKFKTPKFKTVRLSGHSSLYFGNRKTSIDSLLLDPGFEYMFAHSDTLQINDYLLANGDCSTRLTLRSNSLGKPFYINRPAGNLNLNFVSLQDSHAYGPGELKANNTRDLGGNDGWLINSELGSDLYWVGGTGNWSDPAHWSLTSGGPGGACVPFIYDNVFFDENSFDAVDQEVTLDNAGAARNMDWTGAQFEPRFSGGQTLELYGAVILNSSMTYEHSSSLIFRSDSLGNAIITNGTSIAASVLFNGLGEWRLDDDLRVNSDVVLSSGKLDLNKNTLSTSHFRSDNDGLRKLHMQDATISASQDFQSVSLNTTNLELQASGSMFNITATSNPEFLLQGKDSVVFGSLSFNSANPGGSVTASLNTQEYDFIGVFEDVSFNGNGRIDGNHQFNNLTFAPGQVYQFEANSNQTIMNDWIMVGIGCSPIIIESSNSGQKFTVNKSAGTVSGLYLRLSDSEVLGGGTFNAVNSSDVSNNSGWNFVEESVVVEDILGVDQIVCEGEPVVLDASFGAANESFIWSDGSTASTLNVTQPGKYWVGVTLGQSCQLTDTVNVDFKPLPIIDLGADITTCEEQPVTLDATNPNNGATYLWSDGSTDPTLIVDTTGDYWVDVTLADCPVRDSIFVMVDPIPRIDLGPDIVLSCADGAITLDATFDGATYLWQDGSTNPTLEVTSPGTYTVMLDRNGCLFTDEIKIDYVDYPEVDLGPDQVICPNEDNFLDVEQTISGNFSYLWSDGSTASNLKVESEGEFWVTVSNGVCSVTDTIQMSFIIEPVVELVADLIICEGDVLTLDAFNNGATYLWSTGETTASIDVTEPGNYTVEVTDGCYIVNDEINVEVDIVPTVDLGEDVGICFYDTLKLDVTINSLKAEYLWEDGSTDPKREIYEEGIYSVSVTNGQCGTATDELVVVRDFCGCSILAPNVFSPNGDGTNDIFNTVLTCDPNTYSLSIFNRWGILLFRTTDPDRGWDGTFDGQPVTGDFLWRADYTSVRINGSLERISGNGVFKILR